MLVRFAKMPTKRKVSGQHSVGVNHPTTDQPVDINDGKVHKTWMITVNNYSEAEFENMKTWGGDATRLVIAKEVGASGTPHLQCRITWRKGKRFGAMKKLCPRGNLSVARIQDFSYEKKADSELIFEVDNRAPGARNDLVELLNAVKEGKSTKELWDEYPCTMARYPKLLAQYKADMQYVEPVIRTDGFKRKFIKNFTKTIVLYGSQGTGKTSYALAHFKKPLVIKKPDDLKLIDLSTDGLVFDDFNWEKVHRTEIIAMFDTQMGSSIGARYNDAYLRPRLPRFVTTNDRNLVESIWCKDGAIKRRMHSIFVSAGDLIDEAETETGWEKFDTQAEPVWD